MLYVLAYTGPLEDFEISDFATDVAADQFIKERQEKEGPNLVLLKVSGPAGLTKMAPVLRRDIWNLICPDGEATDFETAIGAELLFERIEAWMKEPAEVEPEPAPKEKPPKKRSKKAILADLPGALTAFFEWWDLGEKDREDPEQVTALRKLTEELKG